MKTVQVNGERYTVYPLSDDDIAPGVLVRGRHGAQAFRILCIDGEDVVMRNMRHEGLLDVVALDDMARLFVRMIPEAAR